MYLMDCLRSKLLLALFYSIMVNVWFILPWCFDRLASSSEIAVLGLGSIVYGYERNLDRILSLGVFTPHRRADVLREGESLLESGHSQVEMCQAVWDQYSGDQRAFRSLKDYLDNMLRDMGRLRLVSDVNDLQLLSDTQELLADHSSTSS